MLLAALLGAVLGSFLATLVVRWPEGRGLSGRSACDGCGRVLGLVELVPIISYLVARGRCTSCRARIDRTHLGMELGGAFLCALAFILLPLAQAPWVASSSLLLLTLGVLDQRHLWLPDRLVLPLAALGLLAAVSGPPLLADRAIGMAAGWTSFALIAWAYRRIRGRTGLGAGDAKLLGAIGAWTGWAALPFVILGASLFGFVLVARLLAAGRDVEATTRLPLGTFLAIVAVPAIYWTSCP